MTDFATPWTIADQAPLSMGSSRQKYWRISFSGDLPNPGLNPHLLHWQEGSLPLSHLGSLYDYVSDQIRSVAQSCPTLCDPINCSTPGLPVHHQLPEFTETHVHRVVMPSSHLIHCHPLLLLPQSLPASESFPMSQLFA